MAVLGLTPACLGQTVPPPPAAGTLVASCPLPAGVWFNPGELHSADQFATAGRRVQDFLAASRASRACLRASFKALQSDWQSAGQAPDPAVAKAVDDVIRGRDRYDEAVMSGYNRWAEAHNARLAAGDAARAPTIDFPEAQSADDGAAFPPPPGRLTLPSTAIGNTRDCGRFYPSASLRAHESGRVTIGYDVAADGTIVNPHVATSSGFPNLDAAAMACVTTQWRNTPAIDKGAIVASPGHFSVVEFSLW